MASYFFFFLPAFFFIPLFSFDLDLVARLGAFFFTGIDTSSSVGRCWISSLPNEWSNLPHPSVPIIETRYCECNRGGANL